MAHLASIRRIRHLFNDHFVASRVLGLMPSIKILLSRLGENTEQDFPVHIKTDNFDVPFWLRANYSDLGVLIQIFARQEYDLSVFTPYSVHIEEICKKTLQQGKTPIIIDAGANIGATSLWFSQNFPFCHVVAVEPEPANFAILVKKASNRPNITILNAGLWDRSTKLSTIGSGWGARVEEGIDSNTVVPSITVPELLSMDKKWRAIIAKIDIEGAEVNLLKSDNEWIDDIPLVIFEQHDPLWHWLGPWQGNGHAFFSVLSRRKREYLIREENVFAFLHPH